MRFYLDGRKYWEVTRIVYSGSPKAKGNPVAPFDQPFYIMANLAIGGKLSEENNDKGVARMRYPRNLPSTGYAFINVAEDRQQKGLACMKGVEGDK